MFYAITKYDMEKARLVLTELSGAKLFADHHTNLLEFTQISI
jgi:hypothetical protein